MLATLTMALALSAAGQTALADEYAKDPKKFIARLDLDYFPAIVDTALAAVKVTNGDELYSATGAIDLPSTSAYYKALRKAFGVT